MKRRIQIRNLSGVFRGSQGRDGEAVHYEEKSLNSHIFSDQSNSFFDSSVLSADNCDINCAVKAHPLRGDPKMWSKPQSSPARNALLPGKNEWLSAFLGKGACRRASKR